jgi:hypothetical protein
MAKKATNKVGFKNLIIRFTITSKIKTISLIVNTLGKRQKMDQKSG